MGKKTKKHYAKPTKKTTGWTITWRDDVWTDNDLTGQHLAQLALISGDDRFEQLAVTENELRVYPRLGYMRLINLLAALVSVRVSDQFDGDVDEVAAALAEIQSAPAAEILGAVTFS